MPPDVVVAGCYFDTAPRRLGKGWAERSGRITVRIVRVTEEVVAYQRKQLPSHEQIDLHALDLPQTEFSTRALWYELPDEVA